jgi:hypothetical protein
MSCTPSRRGRDPRKFGAANELRHHRRGVKRPGTDFTYARPETIVECGDLLIVSASTNLVEKFAALT